MKTNYTYYWVTYVKYNVWHAERMTGPQYSSLTYNKDITILNAERID